MFNNEDELVEEQPGDLSSSYEDDFLFNTNGKNDDEEEKRKRSEDINYYNDIYNDHYDNIITNSIKNSIKESERKNEIKISDININNDNTSTLVVNYRKKKRTHLNDTSYYSLKLPKFIDVSLDIKKNNNKNINDTNTNADDINKNNDTYIINGKEENNTFNKYFINQDDHITLGQNKKNNSIIQWTFDNELYEQIKWQKKNKEKKKIDIININNIDAYEKNEEFKNTHNFEENKTKEQKKDSLHILSANQKLNDNNKNNNNNNNNNNNKNNNNNNNYYCDNYDEDSNDDDIFHVKDFLDKYDIEYLSDSDNITTSSNESDDEKNILLKNLELLETNSFIVEYTNGQYFFFINEKTYMLEQDKEINYLIECTDENIMPIHCKLKNKFFIKSITKEDKVDPSDLKLQKSHVFYSLNDHKI
ncbi:conserved Plasmodium protein, unknown function [Plasmodium sp. DRC-Itaito]|nr:conserved Plasmodium protein, unknown function [Plasmodium sp. DRC-Itaito]